MLLVAELSEVFGERVSTPVDNSRPASPSGTPPFEQSRRGVDRESGSRGRGERPAGERDLLAGFPGLSDSRETGL